MTIAKPFHIAFRQVIDDMNRMYTQASSGTEALQLACYGLGALIFDVK